MKKLLVLLCVAVGIMLNGVDAKAFTTSPDAYPLVAGESYEWAVLEAEYRYAEAYKMIELVNKYRIDNGLTALQTNDALMKIAMQRALETNIRFGHNAPYGNGAQPTLKTLGYTVFMGASPYNSLEICTTAGTNAVTALNAFKKSKNHNNTIIQKAGYANHNYYAIGVGIVDFNCVVCFFTYKDILSLASTNTTLKDYTSDEVVPFLTSIKSEEWFNNGAAKIYPTKEAAVAAAQDGSYKKHEDDCDCDDCLAEKDEESQNKIDTVKVTKISKPTVSKKRSGKNTKLTIKFNKTKKFSGAKYQIKVFKDKKCKKVLKSKNTKSSQWKVTINNKKYKKVYVKVRCYKKINGKTYYGKWSSIKTVKTK